MVASLYYQNGDADKASTFSEGFRIGVSLFYHQSPKPTVWRIYGNHKSEEITQPDFFTVTLQIDVMPDGKSKPLQLEILRCN